MKKIDLLVLTVTLILMASCTKNDISDPKPGPFVSLAYENTVLYVNTFDNLVSKQWSPNIDRIYSSNDGKVNTDSIVSQYGIGDYAACFCDTSTAYSYSDWYLPSDKELSYLYDNKNSLGSFIEGRYWCSSGGDIGIAVFIDFLDGTSRYDNKSSENIVICVRKD